jgi:hypothetical protein
VCGQLAGALIPGHGEAAERLRYARWVDARVDARELDVDARELEADARELGDQPGAALPVRAGAIELAAQPRAGCVAYGVSLEEGGALVARVGESLLASPSSWLWRPRRFSPALHAELTLALPDDVRASLPWEERAGRYRLDAAAFAFDSHAAFGRFRELHAAFGDTHASAAPLGPLPRISRTALERWLGEALKLAAQSDGHFPARALQLIIVPQGSEPFGNIARGGGASVLLFVPPTFDAAELQRDWVLPHELSHLLLPFLRREDAWLAEGLATYYQELLRARAGVLTTAQALANIAEALRDAAHGGSGRSLAEESRAMHRTHAYRRVYWGGAGHLLVADVALRRKSRGAQTLDRLLSALRAEVRSSIQPLSARHVLARLDALGGAGLFSQLAERSETDPFPDFEPTLAALGVNAAGALEPHAPLAALREALFAPQPAK